MNDWIRTLEEKASEAYSIAEWASIVNLGKIRDLARRLHAELREEIDRTREVASG